MTNGAFRNLEKLRRTGSTSRVLNMLAINERHGGDPDHADTPLFMSKKLATAIIVKHRLRADERYIFREATKRIGTKIILPFDPSDLRLGGQSVFVGQRGYDSLCEELLGPTTCERDHDRHVLRLIDAIPSLDPFLMREHLRRHGVFAASTYFDISEADLGRMKSFVGMEIMDLIALAFGGVAGPEHTERLAEALLGDAVDEKLEPMRLTLRLEGEEYREGVFSWKGFLYYKWAFGEFGLGLRQMVRDLSKLRVVGYRDPETDDALDRMRAALETGVARGQVAIVRALRVYDDAYRDLVDNQKPLAFRAFLLSAPQMFLQLGETLGTLSHIASYWQYRFPQGCSYDIEVAEAVDLLQEFTNSLEQDQPAAAAA